MSETEEEPEKVPEIGSKEPPTPKNQLVALLTLVPVLGVLWLVMQYLPKLGDWMGDKAGSIVSDVSGEEHAAETSDEPASEKGTANAASKSSLALDRSVSNENSASSAVSMSEPALQKAGFKSQIVEQLGGSTKAEVRHLALSDGAERMVAALKIEDESGGSELIEVFFERDEFGRYLSSEDSPVPEKLVIWSE